MDKPDILLPLECNQVNMVAEDEQLYDPAIWKWGKENIRDITAFDSFMLKVKVLLLNASWNIQETKCPDFSFICWFLF